MNVAGPASQRLQAMLSIALICTVLRARALLCTPVEAAQITPVGPQLATIAEKSEKIKYHFLILNP